jgi:hypothetical protein
VTEYRFTGSVKRRSAKLAGTKRIGCEKGSAALDI